MQEVTFLLKCNGGGPELWFLAMNRSMQKMAGSAGAVLMLLLTSVHIGRVKDELMCSHLVHAVYNKKYNTVPFFFFFPFFFLLQV